MPSDNQSPLLDILADLDQQPAAPLAARFEAQYARLKALPRKQQHALRQLWKRSLAAIAVALALGAGMLATKPVQAATITVGGGCTLQDAIVAANNDAISGWIAISFFPHRQSTTSEVPERAPEAPVPRWCWSGASR